MRILLYNNAADPVAEFVQTWWVCTYNMHRHFSYDIARATIDKRGVPIAVREFQPGRAFLQKVRIG